VLRKYIASHEDLRAICWNSDPFGMRTYLRPQFLVPTTIAEDANLHGGLEELVSTLTTSVATVTFQKTRHTDITTHTLRMLKRMKYS
jgi:hypothetical protein